MPGRTQKASPTDARAALERVFDSIPDLDRKWRDLLEAAFAAEKQREMWVAVECKHCNRPGKYRVTIAIANWMERAKALTMLLEQAKGRPAETKKLELSVLAAQTRMELEAASEEELLALAGGAAEEA